MTTHHESMRVFWPSDIANITRPGVLVGWRNSDLDVIVLSVLQDVEIRSVQNALQVGTLFRGTPHSMSQILERCGNLDFEVLGSLNGKHTHTFDPFHLNATSGRRGKPPAIWCPDAAGIILQVVIFERPDPNRMQYLSLNPIPLALGEARDKMRHDPSQFDEIDAYTVAQSKKKQMLIDKLRLHTVIRHTRTQQELALPVIINQINCSYELDRLMQKNIGLVGVRSKRTLSVGERVVESATNARDTVLWEAKRVFWNYVWPIAAQLFILLLIINRAGGEILLRILEWPLLSAQSAGLKDFSATAQQVDIRLQQFCYWPVQYLTLRRRRSNWGSITNNHPEYIRFYNSLWLVANDVIIGIALGSYIIDNADLVAAQMNHIVDSWFVDGLQRMISWLMDWPAGLKLNNELAAFLGDLFLWVIDYWAGCMQALQPLLPHIVRLIGFSSFAGASLPISLFSDLVSLLTVHIYAFYVASARIYNWQLTIIVSLFHLFRGKKRNILRNRIDSCDYDLDQLLLGTILFTLLTFLLPTVGVFYATFASARMGIIVLKASLDTWLACLNHFPLFALMLRIKDSRRLPGGVRFELQDIPRGSERVDGDTPKAARVAVIKLKSIALPLTLTFLQYFQLGNRIRKHYISPHVFLCLLTGRFIPPIHRKSLYSLQYSMLPVRRVGVGELWRMLSSEGSSARLKKRANGAPNGFFMNGGRRDGPNGRSMNGTRSRSRGAKKKDGMWWSR
ncbi:Gpi1-domain-containing protein [Myriangium duriaei CBS 260.36]|uniref:Gpi1-domain-containing protein n=1 Tax=Myriangium duriaei CBS 260.36 TaxID=1168546 RepID=A0A9P4J631_9PEZI|nr:Gpi1-domain-containing protein [Myriangium duriaei CBS 260.36]